MQWKPITPAEEKTLTYSVRTGKESPYTPIVEAAKKGPVHVTATDETNLQHIKWGVSRAIKRTGAKVEMAVLADKSGVVVKPLGVEPAAK